MVDVFKRSDSSYWIAEFKVDGSPRVKKSTKIKNEDENRAKALAVAEGMLRAYQLKNLGALSSARVSNLINETVLLSEGVASIPSVLAMSDRYKAEKRIHVGEYTTISNETAINFFLKFLGNRKHEPITKITKDIVKEWRDEMLKDGLKSSTMKGYFTRTSAVFRFAIEEGIGFNDPFKGVKLPESKKEEPRPLYRADARNLLAVLRDSPEWCIAVRFAYFHGLRTGDIMKMKNSYIDLKKGTMKFSPSKQGKGKEHILDLPLHPELQHYLSEFALSGEYVMPNLAKAYLKKRNFAATYLDRFFKLAEIDGTFHGFRHGFISTLANAGVSSDLRKVLSHHKNNDVNEGIYTRFSHESKLEALKKIPKL